MNDINLPSPNKYGTSEIMMFLSQVVMHNGFYDDDLEFQCPPGDDRSRHTGIVMICATLRRTPHTFSSAPRVQFPL